MRFKFWRREPKPFSTLRVAVAGLQRPIVVCPVDQETHNAAVGHLRNAIEGKRSWVKLGDATFDGRRVIAWTEETAAALERGEVRS